MLWKPLAVVAAMGSVSAHLVVMSNYQRPSGGGSDALSQPMPAETAANKTQTIVIGPVTEATDGPAIKIARDTFFRFPDGTRVVAETSTENLMIVDLAIPMGVEQLLEEFQAAVNKTPYGSKTESQSNSVKMELWSTDGSGQIVLDTISSEKTSASIRIYGQDLFTRT